ncbi:MAG: hypothetical protein ACWGMZ_13440, partial [Thermoguttaceae bacterium]
RWGDMRVTALYRRIYFLLSNKLRSKGPFNSAISAAALCLLICCFFHFSAAQADASTGNCDDSLQGNSSEQTRQNAIRSIPFDKLDSQDRAKIYSVLSNVTVFRRMPIRVTDCNPNLYMFIVRHPDVLINIWRELKISKLELRQIGPEKFRLKENDGVVANLEFLYRSHNTYLIYAEGEYDGVIFPRPVKGSGLFLLKSGWIRNVDGRCYISSRLDAFLSVEPGAIELVTRALHPLVGKTADNNFTQTVAFVGSLSRTTELNCHRVQRLALQLDFVEPKVREDFANLAEQIARKTSSKTSHEVVDWMKVVQKNSEGLKR